MSNNMNLWEYEYEAYRRQKRRTRMEELRFKLSWWRTLSLLLALALLVAVLALVCAPVAQAESTPPETTNAAPAAFHEPKHEPVEAAGTVKPTPYAMTIENAKVTHYCICKKCCGKDESHPDYGITASGRPAEPYYSIAVDPNVIELGSIVEVDYGDGELHRYRADDTGSGVSGAHIDVCVSSHGEAWNLGVKTATVHVLKEETT